MRYLPVLLAVVAIAAASALDLYFNVGASAEAWAPVIEQGVPHEFGPWVGEDLEVADETIVVAGADGKVSRRYTNRDTGEVVTVWLICGHMQAVARHPPTVCYPAKQFKQEEARNRYTFEAEGPAGENTFWTSWFSRELPNELPQRQRVFWAWTLPKPGEAVAWHAPDEARYAFPGAKALFKLYFTVDEPEDNPPLSENPSNDLAKRMLPVLTELFKAGPENFQAVVGKTSGEAPTTESQETETPASDPEA